jgi:hypothetical protein
MNPHRSPCACCGGAGRVQGATGAMRPCSRCNWEAFKRWRDQRRPLPPPALTLPIKPGGDAA